MLMLAPDAQLASADVIVRYLAIYQRFLTAVIQYTEKGDKPGMLLGAWMAVELKQTLKMLWHCDDYNRSPPVVNRYVDKFPKGLPSLGAPERLVSDYERILSAERGAAELGLRDDLSNLDLAPLPKMRACLELLYYLDWPMYELMRYAPKQSRLSRAWGKVRVAWYSLFSDKAYSAFRFRPWKGLERVWRAETQAAADVNRRIAEVVLPVPKAMVRWSDFDDEQFHNTVIAAIIHASERERWLWNGFMTGEYGEPQ
jgi:hypothetical protein